MDRLIICQARIERSNKGTTELRALNKNKKVIFHLLCLLLIVITARGEPDPWQIQSS